MGAGSKASLLGNEALQGRPSTGARNICDAASSSPLARSTTPTFSRLLDVVEVEAVQSEPSRCLELVRHPGHRGQDEKNRRHEINVLPDHTQKPEVMPTTREAKYFNINTGKSGLKLDKEENVNRKLWIKINESIKKFKKK